MTDPTLEKLNTLENEVYNFGSKYVVLLEKIGEYLNATNVGEVNENDFKMDELLKHLAYLKDEMHKQVDEIYIENSYQHLTKSHSDLNEQLNSLNELKNKIKKMLTN